MSDVTFTQNREALSVSAASRGIDRLEPIFDHDGLVANAGLILAATLMARLGLDALINEWVTTVSSRPGRKILTLITAMIAGATHIDGSHPLVHTAALVAIIWHLLSWFPCHSNGRVRTVLRHIVVI